jgi:uncharacterized cupin superfamily protein
MKIASESTTPEESRLSPKGVFEIHRRHMSLALGGVKDTGAWGGGHPFDVELARIPAGKIGYPLHSHAAQTEYYIILQGSALLRDGGDTDVRIQAGDHFLCAPGEAHQLINTSEEDLVYYVIADQHRAEITTYPHTGKRQIKPEYRYFRIEDVDYYEGEE